MQTQSINTTYTFALGPFEPGWTSPQRLVLELSAGRVTHIEYTGGYNERNCATQIPELPLPDALFLVSRICGACSHAHSLAFCSALEKLTQTTLPPRATALRIAIAELERLSTHLTGLRDIFDTIGMSALSEEFQRLHEQSCGVMRDLTGQRRVPNVCIPGGLHSDVSETGRREALLKLAVLRRRLYRLIDRLVDDRGLLTRMVEVGTLSHSAAEQFALRGPLARASGVPSDVRIDQPYGNYETLSLQPITQENGDAHARMVVLLLESFESVKVVEGLLHDLPEGEVNTYFPHLLPGGEAEAIVEAPRGAMRYVISAAHGKIERVQIDAPHHPDRLIVRALLSGATADDVPLIMASAYLCIPCAEG